jgi:hypothetical protein
MSSIFFPPSSTPKCPKAAPLHPKGVLSAPAAEAPLTTPVFATFVTIAAPSGESGLSVSFLQN